MAQAPWTPAGLIALATRRRHELRVDRAAWYDAQWRRAAAATGWVIVGEVGAALRLRRLDEERWVLGPEVGLDRHVNYRVTGSSTMSEQALAAAGLPTPACRTHSVVRPSGLVSAVLESPGGLVVKPAAGTGGGRGVTVGPASRRDALDAAASVLAMTRVAVTQAVVAGDVLRVLVLDGEVLDAVHRTPATVTGDGRASIRQLIESENDRRAELGSDATGFIPVAADCRVALRRQGLALGDRPESGRRVQVAGTSNTGSEQESRRVALSMAAAEMAVAASAALGVRLAGVDLVVDAAGAPISVLEVNGAPGLHWHHLVVGETFDPFVAVLSERVSAPRHEALPGFES